MFLYFTDLSVDSDLWP